MFFRIFGSTEFRHRHIYIAPCAYITFFAEPMLRLEMMFALSTIRDCRPFPFYVLACSLSVLRVLFKEDTFYSCKYSAFLALFPLLLKKYHVFSHFWVCQLTSSSFIYLTPSAYVTIWGKRFVFCQRAIGGFRYAHYFNK